MNKLKMLYFEFVKKFNNFKAINLNVTSMRQFMIYMRVPGM